MPYRYSSRYTARKISAGVVIPATTLRTASCRSETIPSSSAIRRTVEADSFWWIACFTVSVIFSTSKAARRPL
jgi:hypothetical protein